MIVENKISAYLEGRQAVCVSSDTGVAQALDVMDAETTDAVGVIHEGRFAGIFTRSDFVKKVIRNRLDVMTTLVGDVMTIGPQTILPDCSVRHAFSTMIRQNVSHLPVICNGKFMGIITEDDLRSDIEALMDAVDRDNRLLMSYVYGERYGLCG